MNRYHLLFWILLLPMLLFNSSCSNDKKKKKLSLVTVKMGRQSILEEYPKVPREDILREISGNRLYGELKERYVQALTELRNAVSEDGGKLILVIMTPEVGKSVSLANSFGIPYIQIVCSNLNIECLDLTKVISEQDVLAMQSAGGQWSREGATYVANLLMAPINQYTAYHTSREYAVNERTETFGDLPESDDETIEDELGFTYRMKTNEQGLRMTYNLRFPRTKQRILFLGDEMVFNPYINNEDMITSKLQERFPDKEIINAGHPDYTMDDYCSLYKQKARYAEPDVVFVCTNGGDFLDFFFAQRNRHARSDKSYPPSELEKKFYKQLYNQ